MTFRMIRRCSTSARWRSALTAACLFAQVAGCQSPRTVHYFGEAELQHYKQSATQIDFPAIATESTPEVQFAEKPPTLRDPSKAEVWNISLGESLQIALNNSKILRSRGTFKSPANPLMSSPERIASTYDAAIQETSTGLFQRGTEAALSSFDTQFKTSMQFGRDENAQNNFLLGGGLGNGRTLVNQSGAFQSSLQKVMANGGAFEVSHNWNYGANNIPFFQLFPSSYRGYARADYRQPLLAGNGVDFTRVAGPIVRTIPGMSSTDGGVLIARINTDVTLADFELNVTNMVRDVEDLYWELYLAYRTYDAEVAARTSALEVWRTAKKRMEVGARGGTPVDEAQARENYFANRIRLENAIGTLYSTEGQFRRLLGLSVNDGKILRPTDEPLEAEYVTDWRMSLSESLVRRVELRRQKWQIKSLELQLTAAESLVRPRLDFIAGYQVNGFGDKLLSYHNNDGITAEGFNSAYGALTRGNQTSWDLGFEFSLPIGLRQALATRNNLELRLSKARATLAAQELEITHELSSAVQQIDWWYQIAETNHHRRNAAQAELEAVEKEYQVGRLPVDMLLRSRANIAAAEVGYFNALVKYNQALTDLRVRKGTLLEENNIHLAEGGWTPAAYDEALRRAWARSFAFDNDKLETEPPEFASPMPAGTYALPPSIDGSELVPPEPTTPGPLELQPVPQAIPATPAVESPPQSAPAFPGPPE